MIIIFPSISGKRSENEKGVWITPAFPKLIYVLDEDNITEDSKYWHLTELAAKCTAKRMVPDYISAKIMKEMLGALPGLIPVLRTLVVSTDVFASIPETEVVLYTVFDSPEDLEIYQVHPEHQKCVAFVKAVAAERRVVDYHF